MSTIVGNLIVSGNIDVFGGSISAPISGSSVSSSYSTYAQNAGVAQTASYVQQAVSASFAQTASYALNVPELSPSASWASQSLSASYVDTARTASVLAGTASNAVSSSNAQTASYIGNSNTASYALDALTASFAVSYSFNYVTQSDVLSASFASSSLSSSLADYSWTASLANTSSIAGTASVALSSSVVTVSPTSFDYSLIGTRLTGSDFSQLFYTSSLRYFPAERKLLLSGTLEFTNLVSGSRARFNSVSASLDGTASMAFTSSKVTTTAGLGGIMYLAGPQYTASGHWDYRTSAALRYSAAQGRLEVTGGVVAVYGFTGSISGSNALFGIVTASVFTGVLTGSLQGTASDAVSASMVPGYFVQGILSADQTIASSTDTVINFVSHYDSSSWYNSSTKRVTPTVAGFYQVNAAAWFEPLGTTASQANLQIRKNGDQMDITQMQGTTFTGIGIRCSKIVQMNGTSDYLDFTAYQGALTSKTLQKGNANGSGTSFSVILISRN